MNIPSNYVLIKPDNKNIATNDAIAYSDFVDIANCWSVYGTVIDIPDKLHFFGKEIEQLKHIKSVSSIKMQQEYNKHTLDWGTTVEISKGDRVSFNYIAPQEALDEGLIIDGMPLIRYDRLYFVEKEEKIKPINGWVFVEPINSGYGEFASEKDNKDLKYCGYVRHFGSMLTGYLGYPLIKDSLELNAGQMVMFRDNVANSHEHELFNKVNKGGSPLFRMQRKDILAVMK